MSRTRLKALFLLLSILSSALTHFPAHAELDELREDSTVEVVVNGKKVRYDLYHWDTHPDREEFLAHPLPSGSGPILVLTIPLEGRKQNAEYWKTISDRWKEKAEKEFRTSLSIDQSLPSSNGIEVHAAILSENQILPTGTKVDIELSKSSSRQYTLAYLGSGATAHVYKATPTSSTGSEGKVLAVKIPYSKYQTPTSRFFQFLKMKEVQNLINIRSHRNLQRIYGEHEVAISGKTYRSIVSEFIPDRLSDKLEQLRVFGNEVPLPDLAKRGRAIVQSCLLLGHHIFEASAELHSLGLRHNDIKPDNILLRTDSIGPTDAALTDFQPVSKIREYALNGTYDTFAPESAFQPGGFEIRRSGRTSSSPSALSSKIDQMKSISSDETRDLDQSSKAQQFELAMPDGRASIYSVGRVLYEALVGVTPLEDFEKSNGSDYMKLFRGNDEKSKDVQSTRADFEYFISRRLNQVKAKLITALVPRLTDKNKAEVTEIRTEIESLIYLTRESLRVDPFLRGEALNTRDQSNEYLNEHKQPFLKIRRGEIIQSHILDLFPHLPRRYQFAPPALDPCFVEATEATLAQ